MSTPESAVPSLAETSEASTDQDDVTRVLFTTPEKGDEIEMLRVKKSDQSSEAPSDDSVASSTDTVHKVYQPTEFSRYNNFLEVSKDDENSQLGTSGHSNQKESPNERKQTVCPGSFNLSSEQLADMFSIFDGSQRRWPPWKHQVDEREPPSTPASVSDAGTDAVTTITSNVANSSILSWERKAESLERECATLKEIIKADCFKILTLKSEIESLRADKKRGTERETVALQTKLDIIMHERDHLEGRETQHMETITRLKGKLEMLGRPKDHSDSTLQSELDQLRLENALFATQIVDYEAQILRLESSIIKFQEETVVPKYLSNLPEVFENENLADPNHGPLRLENEIESLSLRLLNVESEQEQLSFRFEELSRLHQNWTPPEQEYPDEADVSGNNHSMQAWDSKDQKPRTMDITELRSPISLLDWSLEAQHDDEHEHNEKQHYEQLVDAIEVSVEGILMDGKQSIPGNHSNQRTDSKQQTAHVNESWNGFCGCIHSLKQVES